MNHKLAIITFLVLTLSGCFKDKPFTEFAQVGGSWQIKKVVIENFDSLGNSIALKEFADRGYILLNFNQDGAYSLAENSFAYSFNTDAPDFNASSLIAGFIEASNRWDVSVNAKHINFGIVDPATDFSTQLVALSITQLKSNKMDWSYVLRNTNGSIAYSESYELERSN